MEENENREATLTGNYLGLKEILETGLANAQAEEDPYHAKGHLIEVQSHFKGLMLRREEREVLYNRLQEAFSVVNKQIEDARQDFEHEALANYINVKPVVEKAAREAATEEDLRSTWDHLLEAQNQVKEAKLLRDHRNELFAILQEAFSMVKAKREESQKEFDQESHYNYQRLKELVAKGLKQAEETHEYKETREFLKKIQSEFKGARMVHEQREELYSRLQTAFDILGKRVDDYFRNKKKNWAMKMEFTVSRFSADIYELQQSLEKDQEYLNELEDQLDIVVSAGKDKENLAGIKARIATTKLDIHQKTEQIARLEAEITGLQNKLDNPL